MNHPIIPPPAEWSKKPAPLSWDAPVPLTPLQEIRQPFFGKEPIPLHEAQSRKPDFPVESLSPTLCNAAKAIVDVIQCPDALAAHSVLGAAALAVQGQANIQLHTYDIRPISLFLLSLAESGERKTSVDRLALQTIDEYETSLSAAHAKALTYYKNCKLVYDAHVKRINAEKNLSPADKVKALSEFAEPIRPLDYKLLRSNITIEGLSKALKDGRASQGLFTSEAGIFTGGHSMRDEVRSLSSGTLNDLWDANTISVSRAKDETSYELRGKRLTMHLAIQPGIAADFFAKQDLQTNGFFARFLISHPESTMGTRFAKYKSANTDLHIAQYKAKLQQQLTLTHSLAGEVTPRLLQFDTPAQDRLSDYADDNESMLGTDGRYASVSGFANKLAEHAARIAAVMTLFENPSAAHIGLEMLERAIAIADYFAEQAVMIFGSDTASTEIQAAEKLREWLLKNSAPNPITLRQIMRGGPTCVRNARDARAVVQTLIDHNLMCKSDDVLEKDKWNYR